MLTWIKGRQEANYEKMLIAKSEFFKFDLYLLKFPDGASIPEHRDSTIDGYEHHRINFVINKPAIGYGKTIIAGPSRTWFDGRLVKFRPDLYLHKMTEVSFIWPQNMYMLSFGWLRKVKL